jgi:thiol:disulfide interchange protein DsbD
MRRTAVAAPPCCGGVRPPLALALLGGALLNLMPCVFPVLSLKVLGFAAHAQRPARAARLRARPTRSAWW